MSKLWAIILCLLLLGVGYSLATPANPDLESRLKALEARVDHLENWAVKVGSRYK